MKFREYVKFYYRNSLTKVEMEVIGITKLITNWKVIYADLEVTDEMIDKIINNTSGKKTHKAISKRLEKRQLQKPNYKNTTDKLLYMMENELGMIKIGISTDPVRRAREITTGSGVPCYITCVWETVVNTRTLEKKVLRTFKEHRLQGEWFKKGSITQDDVEECLKSGFTRLEEYRPDLYTEE